MSIESGNVFSEYLRTNVQLGTADLFEVQTLERGRDLTTIFYEAQVGLSNRLDWRKIRDHLNRAGRDKFGDSYFTQVHESRSKSSTDVYFYFQVGEKTSRFKFLTSSPVLQNIGQAMMSISTDKTTATMVVDAEYADLFNACFEDHISDNQHPVYILTMTQNGVVSQRHSINRDTADLPKSEFYPWLKKRGYTLEEYYDAMLKSRAGLSLLIGPPGVGKSTFLRGAILFSKLDGYMIYDPDTIMATVALDHFYGTTGGILGVEDADYYLAARSEGNNKLSTYLNYADGVIKDTSKKILLSTNLESKSKIDPALLREGRCFSIDEFASLTLDEAYAAREAAGLPYEEIDANRFAQGIALSTALNLGKAGTDTKRKREFGFCS